MAITACTLSDKALEDIIIVGARALPTCGTPQLEQPSARYVAAPEHRAAVLDGLIECAGELLRRRALKTLLRTNVLEKPQQVKSYLQVHFADYGFEAFVAVFLDIRHAVIATEELFRGTLCQTSVYPREVVKRALAHNAAALIVAHNHPSGLAEPSRADEFLTSTLKTALNLVDVRLLDHFVVGADCCVSFAERGLL